MIIGKIKNKNKKEIGKHEMIGIRWYKLRDGKSREYFFFDMKMKEKMNPRCGGSK